MKKSIIKEKSFKFALDIIKLYQVLQEQKEYILSKQLLRSGTSIGANVEEALAGQSKKDFISKMSIASKESRETLYWLRLLSKSNLVKLEKLKIDSFIMGINEIIKILTSIVKTTKERLK